MSSSFRKTYHTGFQLATGATNGYYLQSDAAGVGTWQPVSISGFANGTVSAPSITFTNDSASGLYLPSAGTVGITVSGADALTLSATTTTSAQGRTINVGTSGTTSPLNVYGLISGTNGINLTGGQVGFHGTGGTSTADASMHIRPSYTTTNTSDVYFSYFDTPTITATGGAPANASTVYIAGAPTNSTNAYTLWAAAGRSYLATGMRYKITQVSTATYTVTATDFLIWITGSAGARTLTLPSITASNEGTMYIIVSDPTANNTSTVNSTGGQRFDGGAGTSITIARRSTATLLAGPATGANTVSWWRI